MPRPRAVLFDLDGTLADTFPLIVSSWNAAVSPFSGKVYSTSDVISRFGVTDTAMIQRELPREHWDRAEATYYSHYELNHSTVEVFPGVRELLAGLRGRRMPMGLMTGKGRRSATITLRCLGWESHFGSVVTGDDVVRQKPAPEGLLKVAGELGVGPGECVWVGDSPADMKAGKAAGMYTIAAGWHLVYADRIRSLEPDRIAENPEELGLMLLDGR